MSTAAKDGADADQVRADFEDAVNMAPKELEEWLETDRSREVGWGEGESVGHESGRRIVKIKRTKKDDLSDADLQHMRKVVGYVKRHLAQRPSGDVEDSKWRASLMNRTHPPTTR